MADPLAITQNLIRCPSVTPAEGGALTYLENLLKAAGFVTHRVIFEGDGSYPVDNLYARYGTGHPHFCYGGHTDVVPVGDEADWTHPPFDAVIDGDVLYGRGAVDMKGSIGCFVAAALDFLESNPDFGGSISLLITGDEEADSINGTEKLVRWVYDQGETIDACIVGEPTNLKVIGDSIKVGRRGSLSGSLVVEGIQGHVAYQENADNPIARALPLLSALIDTPLDDGTDHFQPSNLEITTVDVGNPAKNIIPARLEARFNVRFNDLWTAETLKGEIQTRLDRAAQAGTRFTLAFVPVVSENFLTQNPGLIEPLEQAIETVTGRRAALSTGGGSSDARYIKNYCPVIEFGLLSETIHKVDERTSLDDLQTLTHIFNRFLCIYFNAEK
ncbi:MAG: succinyl-diaminopimelate desuccinylase [Pseudomonadota bacterium]